VGTNGKSTTAHILKAILEKQNIEAFANIDRPLSAVLNEGTAPDFIIAACSPQQLEGTRTFKPKGILFLNLAEDMTDRYPNIENYFQANREVLKNADSDTWVVFNSQDSSVVSFVQNLQGKTYLFGMQEIPSGFEGAWCQKNKISIRWKDNQLVELDISQLRMRGFHNRENLMAASLAALNLGVKAESIQKTIVELKALPHRVQFIKRINDVAFYSDAYATNPAAVIRTLGSFVEPVILIMGGKDKEVNFSLLAPHIRLRVKNLIITGESKEKINRFLGDYTETFLVGTLEEATLLAYQKSRSGDVVLLSPGCMGTDKFPSQQEMGDFFAKLAVTLSQPRKPNVL
jgi:UDP-N-acetylmuramoylalanine--D-glutamate ligase